ncbi:MAG: hypothetical protein A3B25_01610 [Candidatus Ryanbacteria bacterium RIFCSPLOWO2_01_FULL_48_26]|uniref:Uncharacterized protein n=1 Tax=Candidatus Ryanbacteria bacterium RIFCSPLOWO2_01_FULL_48_26 TaxID=1802126 RepID=A0A1G2GX05_9BACT|nr:MAG: hypothetical protein A3B25_01610 [Candidatus Ryanbacteria bacterium RIFCSPLOWO2_01_FULL_48_26]OHB20694.1 MAG: hypothetical protein A3J67_05750 [Parcubacteria group bacterium RIFCSPHIGHO2_02_FULL_48_10b]
MNTPKKACDVTLKELDRKLNQEAKRIVREKEEDIIKYVSKKANLTGNSSIIFKNKSGAMVTLSFRLNKDGNLRFAFE